MDAALFVRRNTAIETPPLVPDIRLHLATEITPIWQASEESLARRAVPPPFWAFAWAGGQALARYLLDHPETVAGRCVLDFAAGSGVVAIAAAKAGAQEVVAADTDPFAAAAIAANAALNEVRVEIATADMVDPANRSWADQNWTDQNQASQNWDVVAAGDVCYEREMAERVVPWLRALAGGGALVLLGDPGRAYLPPAGLVERARYLVPTSRELEDREERDTVVWQVLPG